MNYETFRWITGLSGNSVVDAVMRFAAQDLVYVLFGVFAVLCVGRLRHRQIVPVLQALVVLAAAFILGLIAAALHPEQRPFTAHPNVHELIKHSPGQSFPSDHATAAFAIALAVLFFYSRRWGIALLALALLIAFARVYVGVHYPGDVLGSLVVAGLGVLVAIAATPLLKRVPSHIPAAWRG